ncbi:MAG: cytochrome c [Rhodanobacteraceae bacterium]|nr:MAG: cytochrome c [Rhodanobacteraceae bacterium]
MNAAVHPAHGRRWPKVLAVIVIVLIALVILAWLGSRLVRAGGDPRAASPVAFAPALVEQGVYVAKVGDCAACHTAPGGKPFAGGLAIASPVGTIYSTNITPDQDTGIGAYTYGEFERAVRRGVDRAGRTLYPAMPYPSYARVSDTDVAALYAYFMHGVQPVHQANHAEGIPWPLSMRWPLAYWRGLFAPRVPASVPSPVADPLARGAYLVEGLGHCGACHTPRAITLQEKALADRDGSLYLSGGINDNWVAPSLRGDAASGLGSVSKDGLVALLETGRSDRSAVFGGMTDVVAHSTQYMSDADLQAVADYLKSLAPRRQETAVQYDPAAHRALFAGEVAATGAQLYVDNCAACHCTDGKGYAQVFPALAGNPAVNGADPTSLIHLVLAGGTMPGTQTAPTQFSMPPFDRRLSDQELAKVLSFVRTSWGNRAAAVSAVQVRKLRAAVPAGRAGMTDYDPRNR